MRVPEEAKLDPRTMGMRVDVLEWRTDRDRDTRTVFTEDGDEVVMEVLTRGATVLLAVTVFDAAGRALLAEKEYEGHFESTDPELSRDELLEAATRNVVEQFMADITPTPIFHTVTLDDDDSGQEEILDLVEDGQLNQAADALRAYLGENPDTPSACYNLAIVLEGLGQSAEALTYYDRAIGLENKSFYARARDDCARRKAAAQAFDER